MASATRPSNSGLYRVCLLIRHQSIEPRDIEFCGVMARSVCGECAERWSTTQVASVGKVLRQSLIARQYLWLLRPTFGGGCHRKCPHPISRRYWSSLVPFPLLALPSLVHLKSNSRRDSLLNTMALMTYSREWAAFFDTDCWTPFENITKYVISSEERVRMTGHSSKTHESGRSVGKLKLRPDWV